MGNNTDKVTPMTQSPCRRQPVQSRGACRPGRAGWLGLLLVGALLGLCACGQLRPQPAAFDSQAYTPIKYQDLLAPRQAGLHAGQKIQVKAYFWQYLNYDPAMLWNYLTLPRYPIRWYQLRWFATYGSDEMTGYYDLAAVTPEQAEQYKLQRLEPVRLYGELSQLGPGLYLQVFHIEKIED
jgi:hypothetical protein